MKALQIINESSTPIVARYLEPELYFVTIKESNGLHVFYVKLKRGNIYEVVPADNFKEEHLAITRPLRDKIRFEVVEVESRESLSEMQIPLLTEKVKSNAIVSEDGSKVDVEFTGNIQNDLQNYFDCYGVGYHTETWSGLQTIDYVGFVNAWLDRWYMTDETAKAIEEKTLQVGDFIHLQNEPTETMIRLYEQPVYELKDWD